MQGMRIEFEWTRFADYGVEVRPGTPGSLLTEGSRELLAALGPPEAALKTRPLELSADLYLELAKAKPTLEGHKEFAKRYGLLTDQQRDYVYEWPKLVENMRDLVTMVTNKEYWDVRGGSYVPYELPIKVALRFGPSSEDGSGMALSIVPTNLYNALVLQCVSNRATGAEVRSCKACGGLFEIGGSSGHRSNREFCSDKCRFTFNHRSRRKRQ
jgi:hypothetical protein